MFWPVKGKFWNCFSNVRPLGVEFWYLEIKLGTLGVIIRPLSVNFRPRIVSFRRLGVDFVLEKKILDLL